MDKLIKYPERNLKTRNVTKKELVAFHEAGHAVMCSEFQLIYTKVSIKNELTEDYNGIVETPNMLFDSEAFNIWGYRKTYALAIIQYLSGIISEAFYSGQYDWFNAQDDMNQVEFVRNLNNECYSKYDLWKLSEKIVIKNWGKINLIAESLINKYKLNKKQIETILKNKIEILNPPALLK